MAVTKSAKISVIIPALNEEKSIGKVLADLPANSPNFEIIVCDNGSTDSTVEVARKMGAKVVFEPQQGYGAACLKALAEISEDTDIIVFLDADYSDDPSELEKLISPILSDEADMVIGSRVLGKAEKGALLPQAKFGNRIASLLIHFFWDYRYTDLGPFRAISTKKLKLLNMDDRNFGWTVQMQIRALKKELRVCEVPVSYRRRIGVSKISGTIKGSILAGSIILKTIFVEKARASHP